MVDALAREGSMRGLWLSLALYFVTHVANFSCSMYFDFD